MTTGSPAPASFANARLASPSNLNDADTGHAPPRSRVPQSGSHFTLDEIYEPVRRAPVGVNRAAPRLASTTSTFLVYPDGKL